MKKVISIISGFITNSSSVINGFDASILDDKRVKTLMAKYGVQGGFIGEDFFSRNLCGSLLVTPEQKATAKKAFAEYEFGAINYDFDDGRVYVMYGDEYHSLAHELSDIMKEISDERKLSYTRYDVH